MRRGIIRAQSNMSKKSVTAVAVSMLLIGVPLLVQAAQITPTPNPAGSTIDIVNDPFAFNMETSYVNSGALNISQGSTLTNNTGATLSNNGGLSVNSTGTLLNNGILNNTGHYTTSFQSTFTNTGTFNNFGMWTEIGTFTSSNSIYGTVNNYGFIDFNQTNYDNRGILNNFGTISTYHARPTNSAGATLNNYGLISFDQGTISNAGTLNNFGTWRWGLNNVIDNSLGATLNNYGSIGRLADPLFSNIANAGTVNNFATIVLISLNNTGTLKNDGTLNTISGITNAGTVINTGVIAGPPPDYTQSTSYIQTAGQTINNGTLSQPGGVDIQGGSLRGTGVINAPVTIGSGALLSPGTATTLGTLTINGDFQSSGDLLFRIGGAGQFDVLAIHGMAFLNGGTIGVNFVNFTPVAGSSWDFLSATAISGLDTLSFAVSGLSSNLTYAFNYSNGVATLTVHNVPEPSSFLLLAFALGGLALWRRLKGV